MQPQSSKSTGRKFRSTKTCGRSRRRKASGASMSSAADSPARTSALPEKATALPVQGPVFGASSLGSLASYDPATLSWRTSQRCLLEEWAPFSATFPRSGMTRSGTLFRLQPLVRRTGGKESGLWATPVANQSAAASLPALLKEAKRLHLRRQWTLATQVAAEHVHGHRMWPTPQAADRKGTGQPGTKSHTNHLERGSLLTAAVTESTAGGQLNPTWVEWLMGFPLGWTALDASATPLSRKSLKSSGGRS
jgi:hypothetical protein